MKAVDATTPEKSERREEFVQSVERAFAVVGAFSRERPILSLSEVAGLTGLSRATARRLLLTLRRLGYVRSAGRHFSLTPRVLGLGYAYLSSTSLGDVGEPHMNRVVEVTHESCSIAVLDGAEVVYVARVPTKRLMTVGLAIGSRLPAHATSLGRVLLAHLEPAELDAYLADVELRALTKNTVTDKGALRAILERVRQQGWALVDQELEEGLRSIAAPIRVHNQVVAAMNVSAHAGRISKDALRQEFLPVLRDAAQKTSAELVGAGSGVARLLLANAHFGNSAHEFVALTEFP